MYDEPSQTTHETLQTRVDSEYAGLRLDVYLASSVEDASRSFLKKAIKDKKVSVNGTVCAKPGRLVSLGEEVCITIPPPPTTALEPEDIPLDIIHEDNDVVVINKPTGMVVHPAPGHYSGTLVHALLHHCRDFYPSSSGPCPIRPGIVHRLDRYTSGLLVIAKNPQSHEALSHQAREHRLGRQYAALVQGDVEEDTGHISASIGRSLHDRKRMAVTGIGSRHAVTRFTVRERFGVASLLDVELETGRTHQIRVHLRFAGHPVLGDAIYGITNYTLWSISEETKSILNNLAGQALHAARLSFVHPTSDEMLTFSAPLPDDFSAAVRALRDRR